MPPAPHRRRDRRIRQVVWRIVATAVTATVVTTAVAWASASFDDVDDSRYYADAVEWAAAHGITTGSPAGSRFFRPDEPATRGQLVTILKRYHDALVGSTLGSLRCTDGQTVVTGSGTWACADPPTTTTAPPPPPPAPDALEALGCTPGRFAYNDAGTWRCAAFTLAYAPGTEVNLGSTTGTTTATIVSSDGAPFVVHVANTDVVAVHCTDVSCSGTTSTVIGTTPAADTRVDVVAGAGGHPLIAWGTGTSLEVVQCDDAACATSTAASIDQAAAEVSVAVGVDGDPVIAHQGTTSRDLRVTRCGDPTCTGPTTTTVVDASSFTGYGTAIAIGADGVPIVAYDNFGDSAVMTAHCGDAACTSATITTHHPGGVVSQQTASIAVGADGLPLVAFQSGSLELLVLHCDDTACTQATTSTLDAPTSGYAGGRSDIAIGPDGVPVIAYLASANFSWPATARLARCLTPTCTTGAWYVTVSGSSGPYRATSVAISGDGRPLVAYATDTPGTAWLRIVDSTLTGFTFD